MWVKIAGHPNYSVSNDGNVRNDRTGRILTPVKTKNGYLRVGLDKKMCRIHRLVAENFLENPNGLQQINHIDGNKENNKAENLEWCTASQNIIHAQKIGLKKINYEGIKNPKSVIQMSLDGNVIGNFESTMDVQRELGFDASNISKACRNVQKSSYGYKWQYANL